MDGNADLNLILSKALGLEESGLRFFSAMARLSGDAGSRELFKRLAAEAESHFYILREAMKRCGYEPVGEPRFGPSDSFTGDAKGTLTGAGPARAMNYAIRLEQRVVEHYRSSLPHIRIHDVRKVILSLIRFKESHKELLSGQLLRLLDDGRRCQASFPMARANASPC
ncbi:MAG: hypothetical protein HZB92_02810 [Euryarchaeota archaeon]|nr:hypothetical protein [Euryarchaeota archaeon]